MDEFLLFSEDRRRVVCEQAQDKLSLPLLREEIPVRAERELGGSLSEAWGQKLLE